LEKEILFQSDLEEILGKRPFDNRTTYDEFVNGIEPKEEIEEIKQEETVDQSIDLPKKSSKKD
jgi:cell division protease FtsH